ncbi:MAG: glycosyltransferase [Synergistaceae bacterium]|nr:glycosyltransferase [Synergistaceae bacterium]
MDYRIALFYASAGAGHKAAAEALKEWCEAEYPGVSVFCRDVLDYVPQWVRWSVTNAYLSMARNYPWLWHRFYRSADRLSGRDLFADFWEDIHRSIGRAYVKHLIRDIDEFSPDAVLVTHFFGMASLLDKWDRGAPIYYVGTDYISHKHHRDPRYDGWFVGSAESARQHRADKVPTSELAVQDFGIPISRKFLTPPDREEARKRLEVDERAVMVLVCGGSTGGGPLGVIADSMLDCTDWRVDVVCGDNGAMMDALRDKYYPFKHINVHGVVDDIRDYYAASDAVILKPCGVSCAEALAMGSPVLLMDPLPGNEQYNCDYLLEQGAALRLFENRSAGEQITELLDSAGELERVSRRAGEIARPDAAKDILAFVAERIESDRAGKKARGREKQEARKTPPPDGV